VDTSPTAVAAAAAAAAAAAGTDTGAAAARGGHLPTSTLSLNANEVVLIHQRRPMAGRGMAREGAAGGQYTVMKDGLQDTAPAWRWQILHDQAHQRQLYRAQINWE
jgi:hypothetical protein